MVSSRRCPRIFPQLGLKFSSDREYLHVEIYILLSLVIFWTCGRGEKVVNKRNNRSSVTIFWAVPNPGPIV